MTHREKASGWKDLAFADLAEELKATRGVLQAVPEEHLAWRPHAKSWTLGELATHVANLPGWLVMTLESDGLDLAAAPPPIPAPTQLAEILSLFDDHVRALDAVWDAATETDLLESWTLRHGDTVLLRDRKSTVARRTSISHMVHHRGQLTVYLRLLDVPVPPTFGPTADERGAPRTT